MIPNKTAWSNFRGCQGLELRFGMRAKLKGNPTETQFNSERSDAVRDEFVRANSSCDSLKWPFDAANGGGGGFSFFSGGVGGSSGTTGDAGYGGGGGGGGGYPGAGGGGGYSGGSGGGGGGGSIIDASALMVLAEVSGVASPDGSPNGEIVIIAVPEPGALALATISMLPLLLFRRQRK